jgi:polar amino acid transport system substrate-binding protein
VLAHSRTAVDKPAGVSIDLARAWAQELGVPVELLEFETAARSVQALADGEADIGFMAIDPLRAQTTHFTPAYVHIEGAYGVRSDSSVTANEQVDQAGRRIVVGAGSAYALYLQRAITQATLVSVPTSEEVVAALLRGDGDVAAGVRQQLEADARRVAGLRVLDGRFMVIRQAMAMPLSRGVRRPARRWTTSSGARSAAASSPRRCCGMASKGLPWRRCSHSPQAAAAVPLEGQPSDT